MLNQTFTLYSFWCYYVNIRTYVFLRVHYLLSGLSAVGQRLVVSCSENYVRKMKNMYTFTWFVVAKIRK